MRKFSSSSFWDADLCELNLPAAHIMQVYLVNRQLTANIMQCAILSEVLRSLSCKATITFLKTVISYRSVQDINHLSTRRWNVRVRVLPPQPAFGLLSAITKVTQRLLMLAQAIHSLTHSSILSAQLSSLNWNPSISFTLITHRIHRLKGLSMVEMREHEIVPSRLSTSHLDSGTDAFLVRFLALLNCFYVYITWEFQFNATK